MKFGCAHIKHPNRHRPNQLHHFPLPRPPPRPPPPPPPSPRPRRVPVPPPPHSRPTHPPPPPPCESCVGLSTCLYPVTLNWICKYPRVIDRTSFLCVLTRVETGGTETEMDYEFFSDDVVNFFPDFLTPVHEIDRSIFTVSWSMIFPKSHPLRLGKQVV